MLDKLRRLRADHLKIQHDLTFYPYQDRVSDAIIQALIDNLRITASATEEDVKKLRQVELAIEQSRQCIAEGSFVELSDGSSKMIQDIRIGDVVATYSNHRIVTSSVEDVWKTGDKKCYEIRTKDGKSIVATSDHRFLTPSGFSSIKSGLCVGKLLGTARDGRVWWDSVISIKPVGTRSTYDMTVATHHNYVANGIITHNSGKTYSVAHTCEFILTFLPTMFKRPIRIGIFAAQLDQAKISYGILRNSLRQAKATLFNVTAEEERFIAEEENARRLVLPDGSSVVIAPINKISQIEGMTLDLIIIDEAQVADDGVVKHSIWPMGKVNNAPRVYIGKAGTKICHFYRLSQKNDTLKIYFDDVVKERRKLYELTNDARHLVYEVSVSDDIQKQGIDSDEIQREYFGKWQIGTGQFVTQEALEALVENRKITYQYKKSNCFAGIDTAKHPDSTFVTVLRDTGETIERKLPDGTIEYGRKKELLNWMELKGENYQDQFDMIKFFLNNYNIVALAIDSTGQGDFMPDMFEKHTEWRDENSGLYRVKFSAISKDLMYKNLKVSIKQLLTTLPKLDTKIGEKFKQQMLDLQQEYKGQLLSCHHPDSPDAHDDAPDSWALAEWAYAKYYEKGEPQLLVVSGSKGKDRSVIKNDDDRVEEYWPGLDDF